MWSGALTIYTIHQGGDLVVNIQCSSLSKRKLEKSEDVLVSIGKFKRKRKNAAIKPIAYNFWNVSNGTVCIISFSNQNFRVSASGHRQEGQSGAFVARKKLEKLNFPTLTSAYSHNIYRSGYTEIWPFEACEGNALVKRSSLNHSLIGNLKNGVPTHRSER